MLLPIPSLCFLAAMLLGCGSSATPTDSAAAVPPGTSTSTPCQSREQTVGGLVRLCERRTVRLDPGRLVLDAVSTGEVRVTAWDRDEIEVVATIEAAAASEEAARSLLRTTAIETDNGVRATGPLTDVADRSARTPWVAVHYDVHVPRRTDLDVTVVSGPAIVEGVTGTLRVRGERSRIRLRDVSGTLEAMTTRGDVEVTLSDTAFGSSINAETQRGQISLSFPEGYSALLDASTLDGEIHAGDVALTNSTRERSTTTDDRGSVSRESVRGTMGRGGARLHVFARHGDIVIRARR